MAPSTFLNFYFCKINITISYALIIIGLRHDIVILFSEFNVCGHITSHCTFFSDKIMVFFEKSYTKSLNLLYVRKLTGVTLYFRKRQS